MQQKLVQKTNRHNTTYIINNILHTKFSLKLKIFY